MKGESLVKKFLTDQKHISVDDCDKLLTLCGYRYHKSGGSHKVYHKRGETPITVIIPKNTKYVKTGYVDKIVKKLNLEV